MRPEAESGIAVTKQIFGVSGKRSTDRDSGEAEVVELVLPLGDDLVGVDPDIAIAGEDVDVGFGFPVGVSLTAVWVAESNVHAREFLVL